MVLVFLAEFAEKIDLKKKSQTTKKHEKLPSRPRVNFLPHARLEKNLPRPDSILFISSSPLSDLTDRKSVSTNELCLEILGSSVLLSSPSCTCFNNRTPYINQPLITPLSDLTDRKSVSTNELCLEILGSSVHLSSPSCTCINKSIPYRNQPLIRQLSDLTDRKSVSTNELCLEILGSSVHLSSPSCTCINNRTPYINQQQNTLHKSTTEHLT